MIRKLFIPLALCIAVAIPAHTAPTNNPTNGVTSKTFAEILTRVTLRDPKSGAILSVKPKPDAPDNYSHDLKFLMVEKPQSVFIEISQRSMVKNVFESYQLKIDDQIRAELSKLKLMGEQEVAENRIKTSEAMARIQLATQGHLKYGMTRQQVIDVLGPIQNAKNAPLIQQCCLTFMENDEYSLTFDGGLVDVSRKKPQSSSE